MPIPKRLAGNARHFSSRACSFLLSATAIAFVGPTKANAAPPPRDFGSDVSFLADYHPVVVLQDDEGFARVAVVPAFQGRVMTSSAAGASGDSFGWINYELIADGRIQPHINAFGGEERIWLGPEGGQFGIFFPPGADFTLEAWQTPVALDTEPFAIVEQSDVAVRLQHDAELTNQSGAGFKVRIDREVTLLSAADAEQSLGIAPRGVKMVGYRTNNRVTNTGDRAWSRETGLLSIWILGMYKPGDRTVAVIPCRSGDAATLGPVVNDAYFGKPPADRLRTTSTTIYFSADGKHRAKIGVSPQRSLGICGSYDPQARALTIVKYTPPHEGTTDYVNSSWEIQAEPYGGDAVNCYNDGPPSPGAKPLGPFYELETSSPAFTLGPGESGSHVQETYHFVGEAAGLNLLSKALLGVSLREIEAAL